MKKIRLTLLPALLLTVSHTVSCSKEHVDPDLIIAGETENVIVEFDEDGGTRLLSISDKNQWKLPEDLTVYLPQIYPTGPFVYAINESVQRFELKYSELTDHAELIYFCYDKKLTVEKQDASTLKITSTGMKKSGYRYEFDISAGTERNTRITVTGKGSEI